MLDKTFDSKSVEPRLYAAWESSGAFAPTSDPGKFFPAIQFREGLGLSR